MADLLYDLLASQPGSELPKQPADSTALDYLKHLTSQPLSSLEKTEPQALSQSSHTLLLSLQALSKKSYKPIIESASHHASLQTTLPALAASTAELRHAIPKLDHEAVKFSNTYNKAASTDNELLARRKRALLLSRNVERLVDVLELPTLLQSAIAASPPNYASALDLNGHIRRLHSLHPASPLIASIAAQADEAMRTMAANLVLSLKAPGLKLAASLRTISWLRRVLQAELVAAAGAQRQQQQQQQQAAKSQDKVLGALFLVCRLATLVTLLDALDPLKQLADQEKARQKSIGSGNAWSGGQQTERYLKRYIEIFREQSFAIVSMYRSIFPAGTETAPDATGGGGDPLEPLPSSLSTFPMYLVDMMLETLRVYLPTVKDRASRDSLLTQVLYCAGSLGRLGGDFGLFLASLDLGSEAEEEWVEVVRRHKLLAGRLESIVGDSKDKTAK